MAFTETLNRRQASPQRALALFDSLEPATVDFMQGNWKGEGFYTGHGLDGLLEAFHWHGKRFEDTETVHPLVFRTLRGGRVYVNPRCMMGSPALMERLPLGGSPLLGRCFQLLLPLMRTSKPRARLRTMEYRGKAGAAMIYDQLPIQDLFRRIDEDTVLGLMDLRGLSRPFFFVLRREA